MEVYGSILQKDRSSEESRQKQECQKVRLTRLNEELTAIQYFGKTLKKKKNSAVKKDKPRRIF